MARTTPGTLLLEKLGIAFALHPYDYDPDAPRIGLQAAEALGIDPAQTFKTLMAEVDGRPVCLVVPSDTEVSMKKLAACFGGKSGAMMKAPDAERLTGYKVGGVSPFGQKRRLPMRVESAALDEPYVFVNGGQRGLQIRLAVADLLRASGASSAALVA